MVTELRRIVNPNRHRVVATSEDGVLLRTEDPRIQSVADFQRWAQGSYYFIVVDGKKLKGGPGSGHHGHRGRPGRRGGSLPSAWSTKWPAIEIPDNKILRLPKLEPVEGAIAIDPGKLSQADRDRMMDAWLGEELTVTRELQSVWRKPETAGDVFEDWLVDPPPRVLGLVADDELQALISWWAAPESIGTFEGIGLSPWNYWDSAYRKWRESRRPPDYYLQLKHPREAFPQGSMKGVGTALFLGAHLDALRRVPEVQGFEFGGVPDQRPWFKMMGLSEAGRGEWEYDADHARALVEYYFGSEVLKSTDFPSWDELLELEDSLGPPIIDPVLRKPQRIIKGGPGSGHWGHEGRPGKRGGSLPSRMIGAVRDLGARADAWLTEKGLTPERRKKVAKILGAAAIVGGGAYLMTREDGTEIPEGAAWADTESMDREEIIEGLQSPRELKGTTPGGVTGAREVVTESGIHAIEKDNKVPFWFIPAMKQWRKGGAGLPGREAAYSRIAEALGFESFVPPTAYDSDDDVSRQLFLNDVEPLPAEDKLLRKGSRFGFIMDRLVGNSDRHHMNALQQKDTGDLRLIDNATTFSSEPVDTTHPWDIFYSAHEAITRPEVNRSEKAKIGRLLEQRESLEPELRELVGGMASTRFWHRAQEAYDSERLPEMPPQLSDPFKHLRQAQRGQ